MSGIFGVCNQNRRNCISDLFFGTDYHSHLGTQKAGIAFLRTTGSNNAFWRKIHDISTGGQFKDRFGANLNEFKSGLSAKEEINFGLGIISDRDAQPLIMGSHFGDFTLVTMGLIHNLKEIATSLKNSSPFVEASNGKINTAEVVGRLICEGENFVSGIQNLWQKIDGSMSILILTSDGRLIAARDRFGITPLVLGSKTGAWAVTAESEAFYNLGYQAKRFLKPGEIIEITTDGPTVLVEGNDDNLKICAFLWIYTGFPVSVYEGIQVEPCRYRCGSCLAKRDCVQPSIVAGVPDSGTAHAIGYANESGVPYQRPLAKFTPGYSRSYTPPDQETRDMVAKMKLLPAAEVIKNQSIVLCDDSIVRGTQLKDFTLQKLWGCGAKEVHPRTACPPLMFTCRYLLSTRDTWELAARRAIADIEGSDLKDVSAYLDPTSAQYGQMIEWIQKDLGVTTLRYQLLDDMIQAIGLPRENLCLHCWTGETIDGR